MPTYQVWRCRMFKIQMVTMGSRTSLATASQAWGLRRTLRRSSPPSHLCSNYPSQLVFKRLSICIENKSEQLEPLTACLLDHVLLHVYVPTLLLSVAAAKERCDEELLPWAEVLSLKADPLMPSLGLIMAMVEEGWWYHELLTAIDFGSAEKKGVGISTMLKRLHL